MSVDLPVVIIGAGPIGLAAAADLVLRGVAVNVLESGPKVASNIRDWGHVRLFSTWDQCIDEASRELLTRNGWGGVPEDQLPTGADLVRDYLDPLAETRELRPLIETSAKVVQVVRRGLDRMSLRNRSEQPFVVTVELPEGGRRDILARAVIDTSGTWQNPNPLGASGWSAVGEVEHRSVIRYGIPDISGRDRRLYAGKRVLVVGGGHSAANALLDLALMAEREPGTAMTWAVRGNSLKTVFGGGDEDQLPARGALGQRLRNLAEQGRLAIEMSFAAARVLGSNGGIEIEGHGPEGAKRIGPFDQIIVATGQRPDFGFARELQLDLHPGVESTRELGPLIDPNLHSCGSVPPHGWKELAHAETDFFVAGVKSYGRAPTFLLLTGYEQVRSVAAHLAGDEEAANDVRLVLPETGVCNASLERVAPGAECCPTPDPEISVAAISARQPHVSTGCCSVAVTQTDVKRAASCCG